MCRDAVIAGTHCVIQRIVIGVTIVSQQRCDGTSSSSHPLVVVTGVTGTGHTPKQPTVDDPLLDLDYLSLGFVRVRIRDLWQQ